MRRIRVLICSIEEDTPDEMTELACFDLPATDVTTLQSETALGNLETTTYETGTAMLCHLLQAQWDTIDAHLTELHRQRFPTEQVTADGHEPITVASRFGTLELSRQVCYHANIQTHLMPGNSMLPAHNGIIITRGLQEWACLLPQELPFAAVARLLGWQTQEAQILGETTLRSLVRRHGHVVRQAEQAEVVSLLARDAVAPVELHLLPANQRRRRAGLPAELNAAVDTALAAKEACPPQGVSWADWDRVLAARRAEVTRPVEALRQHGPEVEANQVLLTVDEVLTPKPEASRFLELRTARIVTATGSRYFTGVGTSFLQQLLVVVQLALGTFHSLLLIADGARWIRSFFTDTLSHITRKTMLLDWHHLRQRCLELSSRICRTKTTKAQFLRQLYRRLWHGDVPGAIAVLEA